MDRNDLGGVLLSLLAYAEREGDDRLRHLALDAARLARSEISRIDVWPGDSTVPAPLIPLSVADSLINIYAADAEPS
jgi:hypothetical protein